AGALEIEHDHRYIGDGGGGGDRLRVRYLHAVDVDHLHPEDIAAVQPAGADEDAEHGRARERDHAAAPPVDLGLATTAVGAAVVGADRLDATRLGARRLVAAHRGRRARVGTGARAAVAGAEQ